MTKPVSFPRHLIFAAALICGVLLALAMHMLGQSVGLDLDGLWRAEQRGIVPAGAALAWWLVVAGGHRRFCRGLFHRIADAQRSRR